MINTGEFRNLIKEIVRDEIGDRALYKIGEVASVGDKVSVIFSGEPEPSQKEYTYLKSYAPGLGDRVILMRDKGTYVVLGKIGDKGEGISFYSHMADNAKKHIAESGSNDDGWYIKFDDGTMYCWNNIPVTLVAETSYGALYRTDGMQWDFPQPFINNSGMAFFESNSLNRWTQKTTPADNLAASFRIFRANSSSYLGSIDGIAIGRWK